MRCRRKPAHRDEGKEGKNRLALPHLHLRNLLHEACVPTKRRPLVLRRLTISEEQGELKCLNESDDLISVAADSASATFLRSSARRKR